MWPLLNYIPIAIIYQMKKECIAFFDYVSDEKVMHCFFSIRYLMKKKSFWNYVSNEKVIHYFFKYISDEKECIAFFEIMYPMTKKYVTFSNYVSDEKAISTPHKYADICLNLARIGPFLLKVIQHCLNSKLLFHICRINSGFCHNVSVLYRKDCRLPVQLQRVMAAEAEAGREARAKVRSKIQWVLTKTFLL